MSTGVKELNSWTLDQLSPIGRNIYDGMVPGSVALQPNGEIEPYLAVWTQPLREFEEQSLDFTHQETAGGLRITVAGHTPGTVRLWSQAVVQALHRVTSPGGGEYRHVEPHAPIAFDAAETPGRYYQMLTFSFIQP